MGNKKRRNPRVFETSQQGPFQVVRLAEGHRLMVPLWRAYMAAIHSNDADAVIAARVLTRMPCLMNDGGHVTTMEQFAATQGFTLLETADSLCSLEDDGLLIWDAELQIGRHP